MGVMAAARPFNRTSDYALVASWWEGHKLPVAPLAWLPRRGWIVSSDGKPVLAGFVYQLDNTEMYWIEGIVSNPDSTKEERNEAMPVLFETATQAAREAGASIVLGSSSFDSLTGKYKEAGFNDAGRSYRHLGRSF